MRPDARGAITSHAMRLARLWEAIRDARPHNGFIHGRMLACGDWTAQPDYRVVR